MPRTPLAPAGSRPYEDGWRAINELIRSGGSWSGRERNVCYRNRGGRFEDVSYVTGLDFPDDGRAQAMLDLDGDGDLDVVTKSRTAPQIRVLRNEWNGPSRGIVVNLSGSASNRDAIGAQATLETSHGRRMRQVECGSGFLSQSSRRLHFGLAAGERIRALEIAWPGGKRERFTDIPDATHIEIRQGGGIQPARKPVPQPATGAGPGQAPPSLWLSEPVPAPRLDGLQGLGGRRALVNFWASWCPPCRTELSEWSANAGRLRAAGIEVITVNVDSEEDRPKAAQLKLPFPVVTPDDSAIAAWNLFYKHLFDDRRDLGLPTSFLLDEQGRVTKVYQGTTASATLIADAAAARRPSLPFPGKRFAPAPGRNYTEMATAMAERGLKRDARAYFEAALNAGDSSVELVNNYALLLVAAGDRGRAEEILRMAASRNPERAEPHANLGLLLLEAGRVNDAIPILERALGLQAGDARTSRALASAYNERGIAHMEAGRAAAGRSDFERAIAADPGDTAGPMNLALHHASEGRTAEARLILERLLKHHPELEAAKDLLRKLQ